MSSPWETARSSPNKTMAALAAVVLVGVLGAVLADRGSPSRPSSIDTLTETVAAAAGDGQQPSQVVANLTQNQRSAAVFDHDGNRLAGADLALSDSDRSAALAGSTVVQVGKNTTQVAAPTSAGNVLAVSQGGVGTGYRRGSRSLLWPVVMTVLVGLLGLALGRLTARRAEPPLNPAAGDRAPGCVFPAGPATFPAPAPTVPAAPPPSGVQTRPSVAPTRPAPSPAPPAPAVGVDELARKYLQLVDAANSPALYHEAIEVLRSAGLTFVDPVGQPFDPTMHVAVGRRATTDSGAHNVVAETIRPGCYGDGRLVREAEVVVYRTDMTGTQ